MAALPYMQLYVADYLADTLYLDVIESGAYLHLLMNYWQTGKPLPDDDKKLARIAKCTEEQWLNVRSTIVPYFVQRDGVLSHSRVERDLHKVRERSRKASEAGKKSGKARRNEPKLNERSNERSSERSTSAEQKPNHTDTDTDTDTDKIEPPTATLTHADAASWFPEVKPDSIRQAWFEFRESKRKGNNPSTLYNAANQLRLSLIHI